MKKRRKMRHKVPHCSNCAEVMTTAPNVIPRSKATWESPKKKRKHSGGCHFVLLLVLYKS